MTGAVTHVGPALPPGVLPAHYPARASALLGKLIVLVAATTPQEEHQQQDPGEQQQPRQQRPDHGEQGTLLSGGLPSNR